MTNMNEKTELSVVVPVFNEEGNIGELYGRLTSVFKDIGLGYEIIFVNDGSSDGSLTGLKKLASEDRHVRIVDLARNFGHQMAITGGLDFATGEAVVILDADLQDPPEVISEMVEEWKAGAEVVSAVRRQRKGESFLKKATAFLFYRIFVRLSGINMPLDAGDFRLIDRKVLNSLKGIRERNRFIRGLISWIGYNHKSIYYDRQERKRGQTKFPFLKMFKFSVDAITSFSIFPLRIATVMGVIVSALSFMVIIYLIYLKLVTDKLVQGWMTLAGSILFLGGMQLLFLGIIGEYIGRIYDEVKGRPLYIVRDTHGFK